VYHHLRHRLLSSIAILQDLPLRWVYQEEGLHQRLRKNKNVMNTHKILSVPRNFSRGRGVGTTSLECSVLECGQVYSTLCCLLVGTSHSDCITMMCNLNIKYGVVVTGFCRPPL
jgi:hypothetical protein